MQNLKVLSPFDVNNLRTLAPAAQSVEGEGRQSPCAACSVRQLTFCAPLGGEELTQISSIVNHVELAPGEYLFDEGEDADNIFSVTAGAMKVYKLLPDGRRQITGFLFAGDFLGLAHNDVYAYTAEAVTHSVLCRFPRHDLEVMLARYPKMERRLLGMARHELAVAQEQMLLLGRKTAKEKIASFLLSLSSRALQRGQAGNPVAVPMTRMDIGDCLGLTTETVSRTFTQLRNKKLVILHPGGKVEMADREGLQDIADGG